MIKTAKGNKKSSVKKTLAFFLIFLLIFQVETPILFSATLARTIRPIKPISTTTTSTITPITTTTSTTTSTTSISPVSNTTEFLSVSSITQPTTVQTVQTIQPAQTIQPVDMAQPVGTVSTTINSIDGPVTTTIAPIQQISFNSVTAIQPTDASLPIGASAITTTDLDGTTATTFIPPPQDFVPSTTTNSTPQVVSTTSGTSSVFDIRPEEAGIFPNEDVNAIVPEEDIFFNPPVQEDPDQDTDPDPDPDQDTDPNPTPNPPVTPTNINPFVPTPNQQNNDRSGGGGGGGGGGGVTLGDGRSPQPTVLNTKLSDFVGGGMIGLSGRLLKFLKNQKNKDKKKKKKKLVQGEEELMNEKETPSEEESTMTLVVDGQEIEVQKGQNAELKAKEALKPILKAIQKDSLGNDLKIDVVQDVTSIFSFQSNAVNVVSRPQAQKESIKVIDNSKQVFIPQRQLKMAQLAKRISPLQFHKIHKLQSIATQEGTFINEFETGADPDHAFPA